MTMRVELGAALLLLGTSAPAHAWRGRSADTIEVAALKRIPQLNAIYKKERSQYFRTGTNVGMGMMAIGAGVTMGLLGVGRSPEFALLMSATAIASSTIGMWPIATNLYLGARVAAARTLHKAQRQNISLIADGAPERAIARALRKQGAGGKADIAAECLEERWVGDVNTRRYEWRAIVKRAGLFAGEVTIAASLGASRMHGICRFERQDFRITHVDATARATLDRATRPARARLLGPARRFLGRIASLLRGRR